MHGSSRHCPCLMQTKPNNRLKRTIPDTTSCGWSTPYRGKHLKALRLTEQSLSGLIAVINHESRKTMHPADPGQARILPRIRGDYSLHGQPHEERLAHPPYNPKRCPCNSEANRHPILQLEQTQSMPSSEPPSHLVRLSRDTARDGTLPIGAAPSSSVLYAMRY